VGVLLVLCKACGKLNEEFPRVYITRMLERCYLNVLKVVGTFVAMLLQHIVMDVFKSKARKGINVTTLEKVILKSFSKKTKTIEYQLVVKMV